MTYTRSSGRVGIILVLYNQRANLELLYESLARQSHQNFCIYFVDNNPSDGAIASSDLLNQRFNFEIKYYPQLVNEGFAEGSNIGARYAVADGCDYLFVLNNDMELDEQCVEQLLCLCNNYEAGVVAPIVFLGRRGQSINIVQEYGASLNFRSYSIKKHFAGQNYDNICDSIPERMVVDFVIGGATMMRTAIYHRVGLWDSRYFAYGDEVDLSKRLEEENIRLMVTKNAIVWHNHNWSKSNKRGYYFEYYMIQRNKYLYFAKYQLRSALFFSLLKDIVRLPLTLRWTLKVCDYRLFFYYVQGMIAGLLGKRGNPKLFESN